MQCAASFAVMILPYLFLSSQFFSPVDYLLTEPPDCQINRRLKSLTTFERSAKETDKV